jgi:hypothetical protein
MPSHSRQQAVQTSPLPKPSTAKYTNKDGTKSITIPKSSASTPPAQPSPTTTTSSKGGVPTSSATVLQPADDASAAPTVNRKKQKRRAKAAAKAAAKAEADELAATTNGSNGLPSPPASTASAPSLQPSSGAPRKGVDAHHHHHHHQHVPSNQTHEPPQEADYWDDETESDDHVESYHHSQPSQVNGASSQSKKASKKKKKQKSVPETTANDFTFDMESRGAAIGISKEKIWNTSSSEERERIKQFWLGLGEDERKSLVKVEKDAVLKKMKEQQKHTCSCTVCGRKRTAIEEELEGLYDAYYEELETFANQPHNHPNGPPMLGTARRLGSMSGLHPPRGLPSSYSSHHPSRGRFMEHGDNEDEDEDELDDEYSDEDELDEDEDGEPEDMPEVMPEDDALGLFNFGQSLTVQGMVSQLRPHLCCSALNLLLRMTTLGGILTVADDLLKNDGKKFIEMMEQLAERRMAREEDAKDHYSYSHSVNGASMPNSHNHVPPDEEEEYDEEDEEEEEYDSQEEEYDEEEVTLTTCCPLGGFAKHPPGHHD